MWYVFFFKQKTAYDMRISDWSSDVCSSDLDKADKAAMEQASHKATTAPVGQSISWRNPDTGHSGTVTPVKEGTASNGDYCREFQQTVTIGDKIGRASCRERVCQYV